jgi:hypothetical protein
VCGGGLGVGCVALLALALARSPRAPEPSPRRENAGDASESLELEVLRAALAAPLQRIDEPWVHKPVPEQPIFTAEDALELAPTQVALRARGVPEPDELTLLLGAGLAQLAALRAWRRGRR